MMICRFDELPIHQQFVDLGFSPPSNSFLTGDQLNQAEIYFPLRLFVNERNFLVQIEEYKSHQEIFNSEYVYFSSYSSSWLKHCERYADAITQRLSLNNQSQVVEVASNDGYLLQFFRAKGIPVLGIEPTAGTAKVAQHKGIETWVDFFGVAMAKKIAEAGKHADLLIGNNVLAHVPNIKDFVGGLSLAIKDSGVITLEFPHLLQLVQNVQFDTIYHEHFSYFSLLAAKPVFERFGLEVFDVEELPTHGGSLRVFLKKQSNQELAVLPSVGQLLTKERAHKMDTIDFYQGFQKKVDKVKDDFLLFLLDAKKQQKKVVGYGAAAKGCTLINYCGLKNDMIAFVADANPQKQGKFLPGSHIPVVDQLKIKEYRADYVIIFPWNIKDEITSQLSYIREWGGKFVTAIPHLSIF